MISIDNETPGTPVQELDAATQAAIEEGLAQADRGETRPWEVMRDELRSRFIDRQ